MCWHGFSECQNEPKVTCLKTGKVFAYPQKLKATGLKQLQARQLLDCILINIKTHFKSRMAKLVAVLLCKAMWAQQQVYA